MIYDDILLAVLLWVFSLLLFIIAGVAEKLVTGKWRICYFVPFIICVVMIAIYGFEKYMIPAYIGSLLPLGGFVCEKKRVRRICSVFCAVFVLAAVPFCLMNNDYRAYDYAADFKKGIEKMEKYYVLAEHKGIDFDELYKEYLPQFEAVNKSQDSIENAALWMKFCARFNDGHVGYIADDYEEFMPQVYDRILGNDYGLALMTLSDGSTVAVNVDKDSAAYSAGIRNGTVITSWDGTAPENIDDSVMDYITFADKDNREFYRALYCAGTGGETVTAGFIDENGNEQTAVLPKIGAYYSGSFKEAYETINQGIETGHMMWEEIDEKTAALRVKMMMYDSKSMKNDDYSALSAQIAEQVEIYKAEGKEHIILDMRSNSGGNGGMVKALASVFMPVGQHYYITDPKWNEMTGRYYTDENGKFIPEKDNFFEGRGTWDKKVTVLVNADSVSAADHFVSLIQGAENVTVMGFTESNGSAQGIGTVSFENKSMLSFSGSLLIEKDGSVFIDSDTGMESGNSIDVTVPFDKEAVRVLFDEGGDYLLKKALEY